MGGRRKACNTGQAGSSPRAATSAVNAASYGISLALWVMTAGTVRPMGRLIMLWTLIVLLLLFWVLGFAFHVAGALIHVLLVIAVILFLVNLISGRRTAI